MKKLIFLAVVFNAIFAIMVIADSSQRGLNMDAGFSFLTGSTKYHISILAYDTSISDYVKLESELEYPYDFFLYNLSLRYNFKDFGIRLSGAKNIHNPLTTMEDSDWIGIPSQGLRQKFSYTESDVRGDYFAAEAQVYIKLKQLDKVTLNLLFAYKFEYLDYAMYGITGWQDMGTFITFSDYENQKVLTYHIYYHIPYLGAELNFKAKEKINLDLKLGISPYLMANDYDDHVLRYKWSKTDVTGWGVFFEGNMKIFATENSLLKGWYFNGNINISYVRATGDQEQYFYADDPGTPEIETGLRATGIDNVISKFQFEVGISIGYAF